MNVYCIVMFEFNYSVGDIRNSDLGEGIICSGEGSGGKGGGKWGKRGREVGVRGEGSGECLPPVHPLNFGSALKSNSTVSLHTSVIQICAFEIKCICTCRRTAFLTRLHPS